MAITRVFGGVKIEMPGVWGRSYTPDELARMKLFVFLYNLKVRTHG